MTTRILLFVGVAWAACSAFAGNFTLKTAPTSLSDWQSPASYVENAAPGAGDTVILPQHTTVLVHDDEMAFISGLRLLKLQAADDSFVHFDLAEDHTLLCAVTAAGYSVRKGGIIKSGAGRLTLNSGTTDVYAGTSKNNYYCSLDVRGGVLVVGSALVSSINFQHVTIAAGGTLLVPQGKYYYLVSLSGDGDLGNEDAGRAEVYVGTDGLKTTSTPGVFSGRAYGYIYIWNRLNTHYTGVDNTVDRVIVRSYSADTPNNLEEGGVVGAVKLGMQGQPSSIGTNYIVFSAASGTLRYLGTGETTDKRVYLSACTGPSMIDGGENGGLRFTGTMAMDSTPQMGQLILAGAAGTTNVLDCSMTGRVVGETNYVNYLIKRGEGSWLLKGTNAQGGVYNRAMIRSAIAVEEGSLQFDTMANAGIECSLGKADVLYNSACSPLQLDENKVDYAYLLGATNAAGLPTTGVLEYVGTNGFYVNTRKAVIATRGGFVNNGGGAMIWSGLAVGGEAGAKTLVLGGTNQEANAIHDLRDEASRPLSVEKVDAGSWTLGGELAFSGTLAVKGGELRVRAVTNGMDYTHYRFTAKENAYNCARYQLPIYEPGDRVHYQLQEFALYDADGVRQTVFLPPFTNVPFAALQPGQAAYDTDTPPSLGGVGRHLSRLFDDLSYKPEWGIEYGGWDASVSVCPNKNEPASWVRFVIALTNGTPAISSYDICTYYGPDHSKNPGRGVTAYTLEGGVDGIHWEPLVDEPEAEVPNGSTKWYSDGTSWVAGKKRQGFSFDRATTVTNAPAMLSQVSRVEVSGGGVLTVQGANLPLKEGVCLALDGVSGGTLSGVVLPQNGTLDVTNVPEGEQVVVLPATLSGVGGLENVVNWTFHREGFVRRVAVRNGHICLYRRGTSLFLR